MNFIEAFKKGKEGKNRGLPTGLDSLDKAIGGVQKKKIYVIAAGPKGGKTTLVDYSFVLEPYLFYEALLLEKPDTPIRINWIYFSFEIDRIQKEFKYAAYFFNRDYGLSMFNYKGRIYEISQKYLLGQLIDQDKLPILVLPEHEVILKEIYEKRIVPLFGKYDVSGKLIQAGAITFIAARNNPTGLRNELVHYAKQNGEFLYEKYSTTVETVAGNIKTTSVVQKERVNGYKPTNSDLYTIVITDHMRNLNKERGFSMKDNIDKWSEYQVILRNLCDFTFVDVVHLNRAISDVNRIKFQKETLYPTGADIKDTGNLSEDADFILTMFNPTDEQYKLDKHFGYILENYPGYRSIHLVESRTTECPQHLATQMYGNINTFKQIS